MNPGSLAGDSPAGPSAGSWRRGADAVPVAGIMELASRAASVDGVAAISGHLLDALAAGTVDSLVVAAVDGSVIGAAVAVGGDPAEIVVEPPFRRHGRGSALVQAALDRQGAVWAYGDLPAAAALAQRLGLVRGRVLLQMRRRSPSGPTTSASSTGHPLPEGVRVRTFVPGQDEEAFLAVNANAFAWHPEQGRLDLPGLQAEMAQSWFDPKGFFLAVTAGKTQSTAGTPGSSERILGFHWTKVHQQDPNPGSGGRPGPIGEVYVLGVDPEAGVRGLGTALTAIGLDHLSRRGLRTVMLYVEGDNDRARALYERFGFATFLTNAVYARPAPTSR